MAKATGSEVFAECLRIEGVDVVFGLVGSAFMDLLDLFPLADIRFIGARHEQNAAVMAEGYARASGKVGVCVGQNGPGVTNLVSGVAQAYANHTPLLLISPSVTSGTLGSHVIQEVDQMSLLRAMTVDQYQVNRADRIQWILQNAFRSAILKRGPVQVDIPRDLFYGEVPNYCPAPPEAYRLVNTRVACDTSELPKARDMLERAQNPVILAGLGVVESEAEPALAALAERIAAPVVTVYQHNDAFSSAHPLAAGPIGYGGSKAAMRLIASADVLFACGTRLNSWGTIPHYDFDYWPSKAHLIHNDLDPRVLGRERKLSVGLAGDSLSVVNALLAQLGPADAGSMEHLRRKITEVKDLKREWDEELTLLSTSDSSPMSPRAALKAIAEARPRNSIVAMDVGNLCGTASAYLEFEGPRQFLGAGSLGGIGMGLSTALGAKVARPDEPVLCISGDGGWSMTLQEVMTAVANNIPVVTAILNNGVYGAERRNQIDYFDNRFIGTQLDNPDFGRIAGDMGALAYTIDELGAIEDALNDAFRSGRSAVLDIRVDSAQLSEPYRRDAFQEPKRYLARYQRQ